MPQHAGAVSRAKGHAAKAMSAHATQRLARLVVTARSAHAPVAGAEMEASAVREGVADTGVGLGVGLGVRLGEGRQVADVSSAVIMTPPSFPPPWPRLREAQDVGNRVEL